MEEQTKKDMTAIQKAMMISHMRGLATEVLWSAFNELKNHPNKTIEECIEVGINEWIK